MTSKVSICYSALADNIEYQAKKQGYTLGKDARFVQRELTSINLLYLNDILTDTEKNNALKRLDKQIQATVKERRKEGDKE